ncbi:MAG: hypothetical protein H6Q42_747 [Deltaproteobacteria bacterium]|nr:hypothetical protein [Deltaproteobacteria bacterium]
MFWKKHPKKFFTSEEQRRIVDEIQRAEDRTSGEIRVYLDCCTPADVVGKARQIFVKLGMTKTRHRNGVLIYLATDHKKFAILGDEGIHQVVPGDYWKTVKDKMQKHFRQGRFSEGICLGVREIGEKLKVHFPFEKGDVNELPDQISEGPKP